MHDSHGVVGRLDAIRPEAAKRAVIAGHPVLLGNFDDTLAAVDGCCTHADSSLSPGCLRSVQRSRTQHGGCLGVSAGDAQEDPAADAPRPRAVGCADAGIPLRVSG